MSAGYAPQPVGAPSGRGKTALILGIVGFLCCQLCSPFAWYIGAKERKAIREGLVSREEEGLAMAGMVLGIIGTVFLILGILGFILWAVLVGFGVMASAMSH